MTPSLLHALANVEFPGYTFEVVPKDSGYQLRAFYMDACIVSGEMERQNTRWWVISEHAVKSEIVQTMFKCVLTSKEHYTREHFHYRGKPIFGPHFDVDALHGICDQLDERP